MLSSDRFKTGLVRLTAKYGPISEQGQFYAYCQRTFTGPAEFDKALDLVLAREDTFPPYALFGQLLQNYKQPPESSLSPAQERGVSPKNWTPLTTEEIASVRWGQLHPVTERLKAKVRVAAYLKRPEFREEAIAEATARQIPLDLIGVAWRVAA